MRYDPTKSELDAMEALIRVRVLCKNHRTCIQAGGLFGVWPSMLSRWFDNVLTFEPHPDNYKQLRENVEDIHNIDTYLCALGKDNRLVDLDRDYSERDNPGAYYVVSSGIQTTAAQSTIDELCCDDLDLIYLDIEGGETDALLGAVETIKRCRPVIGLEDKKNEFWRRYGHTRSPVDMLVSDFNYVQASHFNHDKILIPAEDA